MGSGYYGSFGATKGSSYVMITDSTLVGNGKGYQLKIFAKRVEKIDGYTDVAVHGTSDNIIMIIKKDGSDQQIALDHRRLAKFLKKDYGYKKGNIRLLSCKTGSKPDACP